MYSLLASKTGVKQQSSLLIIPIVILILFLFLLLYSALFETPSPSFYNYATILGVLLMVCYLTSLYFVKSRLEKFRESAVRATSYATIVAITPGVDLVDRYHREALLLLLIAAACYMVAEHVPLSPGVQNLLFIIGSLIGIAALGLLAISSAILARRIVRQAASLQNLASKIRVEGCSLVLPSAYRASEAFLEMLGFVMRSAMITSYAYYYMWSLTQVKSVGVTDRIELNRLSRPFTIIYGWTSDYAYIPIIVLKKRRQPTLAIALLDPSTQPTAHATVSVENELGRAHATLHLNGQLEGSIWCDPESGVERVKLTIHAIIPVQTRSLRLKTKVFKEEISLLQSKPAPVIPLTQPSVLNKPVLVLAPLKHFNIRKLHETLKWPSYTILGFSHGTYQLTLELEKRPFRKAKASAILLPSR